MQFIKLMITLWFWER